MEKNSSGEYTIDLIRIVKCILKRLWLIVLTGILTAAIFFAYTSFCITPKYSSSIMLYVNNNSISISSAKLSISASELSAAQSLVKTYGEILNNRTTLERVIEKADLPYSSGQLSGMINSSLSNGTEIMKVTVTTEDPYEAAKIANCIAEVLPVRCSEIVNGASMVVVDSAIPNFNKVAPSVTKNTAIGLMLGVLIAVICIVIPALMDDKIHDEDYILQTYDCPVLGKIPNLINYDNKPYRSAVRKH